MEPISPIPEYVDNAKDLSPAALDSLLAKSHARFAKQPGYFLLQPVEKVALQLQFDEQSLRAWEHKVVELRRRSASVTV
jgi:hypothetical protein